MNKHENYLLLAKTIAQRSHCLKYKVGCIIVDDQGHIRASGYNGRPKKFEHCVKCHRDINDHEVLRHFNEYARLPECPSIHAEANAILQLENKRFITTMYATHSPCIHCAKLICNTPIKTLYYETEYDSAPWERELRYNLFKQSGIIAIQLSIKEASYESFIPTKR